MRTIADVRECVRALHVCFHIGWSYRVKRVTKVAACSDHGRCFGLWLILLDQLNSCVLVGSSWRPQTKHVSRDGEAPKIPRHEPCMPFMHDIPSRKVQEGPWEGAWCSGPTPFHLQCSLQPICCSAIFLDLAGSIGRSAAASRMLKCLECVLRSTI